MRDITGPVADDPDAIESEIRATRASLDTKVEELQRRLDPRARAEELKADLKQRWNAGGYLGWLAAGVVATGAWMAVAGLRRARGSDGTRDLEDPACVDVLVV